MRVVVLTGAGRAFCSGLDLKDYGVVPGIDGLQVGQIAQRSMRVYSRLVTTLRGLRQPVIAAVNGPAYGGGMCLAMGCDLRFAGVGDVQRHRDRQRPHLHRDGRGLAAPPQIGATNANDLLLTGRVVEADEALRLGLVSRVADDVVGAGRRGRPRA